MYHPVYTRIHILLLSSRRIYATPRDLELPKIARVQYLPFSLVSSMDQMLNYFIEYVFVRSWICRILKNFILL